MDSACRKYSCRYWVAGRASKARPFTCMGRRQDWEFYNSIAWIGCLDVVFACSEWCEDRLRSL
uniref:Uncharacterized protein n=1 Tax=Arundo donax TaxID=35708 RepID=A0A0A9FGF0_ARUDO